MGDIFQRFSWARWIFVTLSCCSFTLSLGRRDSQHTKPNVSDTQLWRYVDPLIGTEGAIAGSAIAGGNSFPGASLPNGMAKPGIDTSYLGLPNGIAVDCNAGFSPLGNVTAVSMMHVSGTGGAPTYGLISQMPLVGSLKGVNLADNTTYWQNRSFANEEATVGLFTTTLLNDIKIEVTSANHSGFFRYTFPNSQASGGNDTGPEPAASPLQASNDVHVLIDLTHVLPGYSSQAYSQKFLSGDLHLRDSSYYGSATYSGGWSEPQSHTLNFCGNFTSSASLLSASAYVEDVTSNPVSGAGTFSWQYSPAGPRAFDATNASIIPSAKLYSYQDVISYAGSGMGIGGLFSWSQTGSNASAPLVVESKLGISYISAEQACASVQNELPLSMGFEQVVDQARNEWELKVLSTVEVVQDNTTSTNDNTLKRMLYSALYQTGLMPTDKTGENPYWSTYESSPYYDDHYTIWDTYRTLLPLYHILFTPSYTRIVSGLISIFTKEGYLPAGRIANWNGRVQGGTHADTVLTDAFVKSVVSPSGATGKKELGPLINWQQAYSAQKKDGDVPPVHNVDPVCFDGATKEGRGALDDYLPLNYITRNHTRSISRGVEYSQNDFAIWSLAKGLNASASEIATYRDRADWWQNQWNPSANTTLPGVGTFTGFPGARNADGVFNNTSYDPLSCGGCGWGDDIYEAKVWETAFTAAPHDMARIITLMGGDEAFLHRLDASFLPGFGTSVGANNDAGTALFNPGNEPSFLTPFLYNYVPKQQWRTVNQTRAVVDAFYSDKRNGYPGNIDAGALPSWLVWNLIGLFPVAGQPVYLLAAPRFSHLRIRLFQDTEFETILEVRAPGLSDTSFYPQSVELNGKSLDRSWISHAELADGGTLVFEMGTTPGNWDGGERPPSLSEYR
ncbi:MAG: hypothetical protein M1820_009256 [Bogoriella megaspora]|nr:MAG: hypothetical protein M1820_009256 [Bogoriella megaspora]